MSKSGQPENLQELFALLAESINEDHAECFRLSVAEVDKQLAELKIDPTPGLEKLRKTLDRAKIQARLERARVQRERFTELFGRCREKLQSVAEPVREEVLALVRGLSPNQSGMVEAYFRKFEQSSEKDLKSLKEDLEMLRAMKAQSPDDEPEAKSD
jgi:ribosomal protein L16 Arg81 hydroxylase